jgi:hypothetical protein
VSDTTATILAERGTRYGMFDKHARVTQHLKAVIYESLQERSKTLAPDQCEALEMIAHKIGRIINGDPDYADSWADIAGYARLVADRLEGKGEHLKTGLAQTRSTPELAPRRRPHPWPFSVDAGMDRQGSSLKPRQEAV